MTRLQFISMIAAIPFVGKLVNKPIHTPQIPLGNDTLHVFQDAAHQYQIQLTNGKTAYMPLIEYLKSLPSNSVPDMLFEYTAEKDNSIFTDEDNKIIKVWMSENI